ncbi:c-type cytochrome [Azospirillum isscasi]|uniref:Cytochrome c n=1 Tax=Azospirillum isscasi TaxID=3053926 RepID=A0ABU0WC16_9PROT|nr:cytochrome c [Azospirillum isscasi]MDQ2101712.1 cytochrome c [Azospirillum isscasi]
MRATGLLFSMATLALSAPLAAQTAPDGPGSVEYGRQLTEEMCGECHRVSARQTAKPPAMEEDAQAPDLTERLADPGVTEMALRSYLRTSHPVMPNIRLTREETDDIVAYLMTMKTRAR